MYICSVTVSSQRPSSPTWITLRNKATISFLLILAYLGDTAGG